MKLKYWLLSIQCVIAAPKSPLNQTWDYIVVGSGAAGIPLADRLSESGKSVLLIERGSASTGRWGGTRRPAWLEGTNLTRFDVPALYQFVWNPLPENEGILCPDVAAAAGCLLGGGTAINAGQFYLPHKDDFDLHQPPGFRSRDLQSALRKLTSRLPWTSYPSADGKSYITNGTQIAINALTSPSHPNPYKLITANDQPNSKSHHLSLAHYFFRRGERSGPLATYLVTASSRPNFRLILNTSVLRAIRNGPSITGVSVESTGPDGYTGTIRLTPRTGRLILSAGVFGTTKILFRSGIGPREQLETVQSNPSEAPYLPPKREWIELPVGQNVDDAPAVYLAVRKDDIGSYTWETAYTSPNEQDKKLYLEKRSGPLAEIQPSLGPVFWDEVKGKDGKIRRIMWGVNSARADVGGGDVAGVILITSNLNTGKSSRGSLSITSNLTITIATPPYFNDAGDHDFAALNASATSLLTYLSLIPNSTLFIPPPGVPIEAYLRAFITTNPLSSNHWVASSYMGESCRDRKAVVDATTKVCGTTNLHVVDAGIINGVPAANPQAVIMAAAERAAEIILALRGS